MFTENKTAEKPYPLRAAHTYIAHIRDYPKNVICEANSEWRYNKRFLLLVAHVSALVVSYSYFAAPTNMS